VNRYTPVVILGVILEGCQSPEPTGSGQPIAQPNSRTADRPQPVVTRMSPKAPATRSSSPPPSQPRRAAKPRPTLDQVVRRAVDVLWGRADLPTDARVAVIPLSSADGGTTRLGVALAEKMTAELVKQKRCRVADRSHVNAILAEKDMGYADLTDAGAAAKAAKLMAVDCLLVGTLVDQGSTVVAYAKLLNGVDGRVVATSEIEIAKDDDVRSMLVYVQRPNSGGGAIEPLSLSYHIFARRGESDVRISDGATVRSGDAFKIWLQANSDCHAYVLLLDSRGKASVLFPHPKIRSENRLRGGVEYVIPPAKQPPGLGWYVFDEHPGAETFYILASYEPIKDMPRLLREMETAGAKSRVVLDEARQIFTKGMSAVSDQPVAGRLRIQDKGVTLGSGPSSARVRLDDGGSLSAVADVVQGHSTLCKTVAVRHVD